MRIKFFDWDHAIFLRLYLTYYIVTLSLNGLAGLFLPRIPVCLALFPTKLIINAYKKFNLLLVWSYCCLKSLVQEHQDFHILITQFNNFHFDRCCRQNQRYFFSITFLPELNFRIVFVRRMTFDCVSCCVNTSLCL